MTQPFPGGRLKQEPWHRRGHEQQRREECSWHPTPCEGTQGGQPGSKVSLLQEFERPDNHGNALQVRVRCVRDLATFSGSSEQSWEQRELLQGGEGNSDQAAYKVG